MKYGKSMKNLNNFVKKPLLWLIRAYQMVISPLLPPRCRFYPTCSRYCYESIEKHGIFKGSYIGFKRIIKCHPFNPGGYDPVPEK